VEDAARGRNGHRGPVNAQSLIRSGYLLCLLRLAAFHLSGLPSAAYHLICSNF
jgi:hypothetical protein